MNRERVLIVGGGVSGLAAAGFLSQRFDCQLVEQEPEIGGYCRTIYKDGYTWDYSGHFFHFRNEAIADYIHARMDTSQLLTVQRKSRIYFRNAYVDYPFQFNIHQLPLNDFVNCLADMNDAISSPPVKPTTFREMVYSRYGASLSEIFLIPYNEKLYSVPADSLDPNSMGRFFPHTNFSDLLHRIRSVLGGGLNNAETYNAVFTYHKKGARAYVDALASYVPNGTIDVSKKCQAIDPSRKRAIIAGKEYPYDRLIISAPLPEILRLTSQPVSNETLSANKVLVFNLGFDRPSVNPDHWVYYPEPEWVFFRVGHYDNILGESRMSLYVEIALPQHTEIDVEMFFSRAISDLKRCGAIDGHRLISWTWVVLDPAYVHVTTRGQTFAAEACAQLEKSEIFPIGRYGRWTYCSIEDNINEARRLAMEWGCDCNLTDL